MTMRIEIKNDDPHRTAVVTSEEYAVGASVPSGVTKETLSPGQSLSYYIHASKRLVITEDPNAEQQA